MSSRARAAATSPSRSAPGAGALSVDADIDMMADTGTLCGLAVCSARHDLLNNNGIFALDTLAFLQRQVGTPPIAEPGRLALLGLGLGLGLAAVLATARRRRA